MTDTSAIRAAQACADEVQSYLASTRVAIVEPLQEAAHMLYFFCKRHWGLEVVSLAHTGAQALADISISQAAIVIFNLDLPDADGIAVAKKLNLIAPKSRMLIVSSVCRDYQLHRLREINFQGYIDRLTGGLLRFRQAIALIDRGETYFSPSYLLACNRLRRSETAFFKLLSLRQQEILLWIAQSLSDEEIAAELGISVSTVKTHRREIMRKVNIPNTPKLIRYGLELGIGIVETNSGRCRTKTRQSSLLDAV